jgi:hypothetical protein
MKFFNAAPAAPPAETSAVKTRRKAIVDRGQAEVSGCSTAEQPVLPKVIRQRFWTPAEAAAAK